MRRWLIHIGSRVRTRAAGSVGWRDHAHRAGDTDRQAGDFALPKDTSYEFAVAHAFDGGLIVGGSATYSDPAFDGTSTTNVEGTVGYRARFSSVFSATATAGVGEHFQSPEDGVDFPYYLLITAAIELSGASLDRGVVRYRNASTRLTTTTPRSSRQKCLSSRKHNTVSAKLAGNWSNVIRALSSPYAGLLISAAPPPPRALPDPAEADRLSRCRARRAEASVRRPRLPPAVQDPARWFRWGLPTSNDSNRLTAIETPVSLFGIRYPLCGCGKELTVSLTRVETDEAGALRLQRRRRSPKPWRFSQPIPARW
jgi:hypothetical protein